MKSEINFDRDWVEYKEGFGDLHTQFWLGLKKLYTGDESIYGTRLNNKAKHTCTVCG